MIDLDAVERGLRSGRLCAAALDVLPVEPLDRSHPLLAAWTRGEDWLEGRLIVTPHAAYASEEADRAAVTRPVLSVREVLLGRRPADALPLPGA